MPLCLLCGKPAEGLGAGHGYCIEDAANGGQEARAFAADIANCVQNLQGLLDVDKDASLGPHDRFSLRDKGEELGRLILYIAVAIVSGRRISGREAVLLRALRREFGPLYSDAEGAAAIAQLRTVYDEHWLSLVPSLRPILDGIGPFVEPYEAYDVIHGSATAEQARALLFRVANAIAKANGRVTQREGKCLESIREKLWSGVVSMSSRQSEDIYTQRVADPPSAATLPASRSERC